ncbi:MAG: hypothetical protein N2053_09235, partial [Chitinispirillaceae bacterium]|nr:hypothetical protein [Chitinispirillaceae bacterium]
VKDICNQEKADGLIIAGDLFNIKTPSKNSHLLVNNLMDIFKQVKCPIYVIEGKSYVGEEIVCEGEFTAVLVDK